MQVTVSDQFSFNFDNDVTIKQTKDALKKYHDDFEDAFGLNSDHPIFLDTNILLNYYGMSTADKEKLKKFFTDNIKRVFITQQIEREFQRNRIATIENYFEELKKIKTNYKQDLQEGIKNKFNNILQSKIVEKDFPEIRTAIQKIYDDLEIKLFDNSKLEGNVSKGIDKTLEENKNLIFLDPILDVYNNFQRTPNLTEEEIEYLKESYSKHLDTFKDSKESGKDRFSFPGCGEKKEREPYGDYIIFHEILKFMAIKKKDVIFLTRDVTKSDWLQKSKAPFVHYIEKTYQITGHLLYIFDATDLLTMISFEDIYQLSDGFDDDDETTLFHKDQFNNLVDSVVRFFERSIPVNFRVKKVDNRALFDHDVDFVIESPLGTNEGVIVYNCGNITHYKRSIQKRVNACNKLISDGVCNSSTLVVNLNRKSVDNGFDYDLINSFHRINIIIGSRDPNGGEFIKLKDIQV